MNRVGLLIVMCCVLAACSPASLRSTNAPPADPSAAPTIGAQFGDPADLVRVVDGDTIEVDTGTASELVRLIGINAPERDECHGDAASAALAVALRDATISLERGTSDERDGFGRLLRYIRADGEDVNQQLLHDGHAFVLQTDHSRLDGYVRAAGSAAELGLGLWGAVQCGDTAHQELTISSFEANPPGPDDDPNSGEYVVISRWVDGPDPWNLAGWVLRDESSVHRYEFPNITIGPTQEYTIRTGCGSDRGFELFWCAAGPVWSNGGDTIILLDPAGNVVDHLTYRK